MRNEYVRTKNGFGHSAVILILIAAVVMSACGGGEGTLTVTTWPVKGMVIVDGTVHGTAPVSVVLDAGRHEVVVGGGDEQYEAPGPRFVTVTKNGTTTYSAVYRNRFLDGAAPPGFEPADSLKLFGTADAPLRDGTIFDYINGGGVVYIDHGLVSTTHAVYGDSAGNTITVDIHDMGTPGGAAAAIADDLICPGGFEPCSTGDTCKAYAWVPDYIMYFNRSRYLVYAATTNDSLRTEVETIARSVDEAITAAVE